MVPGGVAVRPAGMEMLPALMKAGVALGLVSVSVMFALVLGVTVVGAKATVIEGVAAARPVPESAISVGLVGALELIVMVPASAPVRLGAKIRLSTQLLPGAMLIGAPVRGAPPAEEPKPQ